MMRPTAIKGAASVAYYDTLVPDDKQQRSGERVEDYYLSTDEQPGVWWGAGAAELGLAGEGTREQFHAVMDGRHPQTGEALGRRLRADGVRGFDLTFSAPKSVSVLSGICGGEVERAVVAGHDAAVRAVMASIEQHATTRAGTNGIYRLDVTGLSVLLVRHRTSRTLDPQLHTHAVVAAKVKSVDGRWRALDATMVYRDQRALGAIYQAALRAELTQRLGVGWGPVVKGQAEMVGVPEDLLAAFSTRTAQTEARLADKRSAFVAREGREPSPRELSILTRDAARESRPAKARGQQADRLRAHWLASADAHGYNGQVIATAVMGAAVPAAREAGAAPQFAASHDEAGAERGGDLVGAVLSALAAAGSVWTIADVHREVAARLPTAQAGTAAGLVRTVEATSARLVAQHCLDLAPADARGVARDALDEPGVQRYTTRAVLEQEQRVVRLFSEAAAAGGQPMRIGGDLAAGLDPEQASAAGLVAGEGRLVVVVGPAGAGKTRALRAAVLALDAQRRPVVGLAPWAVAAEQLAHETGVPAETVARFLTAHEQAPGHAEELPVGATVVVDEAGLLSTPDMERLMELARRRLWRVALVGDSRQLAAVGRGGMFDHARTIAPTVQLREVRRFDMAWEREASVALRDCEAAALDAYEQHGRVRAGTAVDVEAAVLEDWWQTTMVEQRRGAFTVSTNDQAQRLNDAARRRLVSAGAVDDARVLVTARGERVGAGMRSRRAATIGRRAPSWDAGCATASAGVCRKSSPTDGSSSAVAADTSRSPPSTPTSTSNSAYFTTVHSAQGLTRDVAATVVDEFTGWRALYVGMTRGRERNTAYVVAGQDDDARATLERVLGRDRADLGALGVQRRLEEEARLRTQRRIHELQAERARLQTSGTAGRERLAEITRELEHLDPRTPTRRRPPAPSPPETSPQRDAPTRGG